MPDENDRERRGDLREAQEERAEGYSHDRHERVDADADDNDTSGTPPPAPGDANPLAKQEGRAYDRRNKAL